MNIHEPAIHVWKTWEPPQPGQSMRAWHDGRCAMCGYTGRMLEDHCHETGLIRGFLCASCNADEGFNTAPMWDEWRAWNNPARAHGWCEPYRGFGTGDIISPRSPGYFMDTSERAAYWQACADACAAGEDWPLPIVLSADAEARRKALDDELDRIAEMLT